jgi:sugar (pentulose or hexulose) kinase
MQIMADALGVPVYPAADGETTLRGAACLALGLDPLPQTGPPVLPIPAHSAVYAAAAQRQQALYRRLYDDSSAVAR